MIKNLSSLITEKLQNNKILSNFYQQLYRQYTPDISGYVITYMIPPDLSGYRLTPESQFLDYFRKNSSFFAIDITPPTINVNSNEVSGTFSGFTSANSVNETHQLNITYVDDSSMTVYSFHKIWMDYLRDVTIGNVEPDEKYINGSIDTGGEETDSCYIDYYGSVFVIKFRPSLSGSKMIDDIMFIGKGTGIYPASLSDKESIGRRDANELVMLPVSYNCVSYRQYVLSNDLVHDNNFKWIYEELKTILH